MVQRLSFLPLYSEPFIPSAPLNTEFTIYLSRKDAAKVGQLGRTVSFPVRYCCVHGENRVFLW